MVFVQHHTIVSISDDTGSRVYLGDGLVHPVQGNEGQQGRTCSPLGRPCGGGRKSIIFQNSRFEPGFELPTNDRCRFRFGQKCFMVDAVEAFRDINFQRLLRSIPDLIEDRSNRIPTRATWAKAIGMRRELGFPFGF